MSVNELQALTQKFADAFDRRDLQPVMEMLSEESQKGTGQLLIEIEEVVRETRSIARLFVDE
jgi:hypothetical protein